MSKSRLDENAPYPVSHATIKYLIDYCRKLEKVAGAAKQHLFFGGAPVSTLGDELQMALKELETECICSEINARNCPVHQ